MIKNSVAALLLATSLAAGAQSVAPNVPLAKQLEDAIEKAREWAQMDKAASERSFFGLGRKRDTDRDYIEAVWGIGFKMHKEQEEC